MSVPQQSSGHRGARFYLALGAMLVVMLIAALVASWMGVTGARRALFLVPILLVLGWVGYESVGYMRRTGNLTSASRAYTIRFTTSMILFMVVLSAVNLAKQRFKPDGALEILLALLPALPLLGVIWSMARYLVEEKDEFQRGLLARRCLIATGFQLTVMTVWGFLERPGMLPHLPASYAFVIWCMGLAVAAIFETVRWKTA